MYAIYTDGGCRKNDGNHPAAWAMVVYKEGNKLGSKSGYFEKATNNYVELEAVLQALKWVQKANVQAIIYSDSAYVVNGYNQWVDGWKSKHWRKSDGNPVLNLEQWRDIYHLKKELASKVSVLKVKGHSGNDGNDAADLLCNVILDERDWEKV